MWLVLLWKVTGLTGMEIIKKTQYTTIEFIKFKPHIKKMLIWKNYLFKTEEEINIIN